jgi:hypothetical protein
MILSGVMLERPHRSITEDSCAGEGNRSIPGGDQETLGRVNVRACADVVMMAQRGFNLAQRFAAFHFGLAFPEHYKALATYAATGFNCGIGALQENLHGGEISSGVCWVIPSHTMKVGLGTKT